MPTALVTGASSGIGRVFAQRLAKDGHDLVLVARDVARLDALATELTDRHGIAAEVLPADLGDRAQLAAVEARLSDDSRPVDLLVNNAGYALKHSFLDNEVEAEATLLDVLVGAVLRLSHAAARSMAARSHGAIVNVSSVAGFMALSPYSAHKAWVTTFSQALANDLEPHGVRVLVVCPGFVRTEFQDRMEVDSSDVPEWSWLDAEEVVDDTLSALDRGRTITVPDVKYKVAVSVLRHVPASVSQRIAAAINR